MPENSSPLGVQEAAHIGLNHSTRHHTPSDSSTQFEHINGHTEAGKDSAEEGRNERQTKRVELALTVSLSIFATIWGILARLGVEWIASFSSAQVFNSVWAQGLGCFVMGIATKHKQFLTNLSPSLFVAISTGFAGSVTTFSAFQFEVFSGFANFDFPGASRFTGFTSGFAVTFVTWAVSFGAFIIGTSVANPLPIKIRPIRRRNLLRIIFLTMGPIFWLGAMFLVIFGPTSWRHKATFAILLGPPGTLLRFLLARKLNLFNQNFPFGTFTANILGCLIFAIASILRTRYALNRGLTATGCSALIGLEDGFCGALTTISTMIVELDNLKGTTRKWKYFLASWLAGQAIFTLVLGSWIWSGDRGNLCSP